MVFYFFTKKCDRGQYIYARYAWYCQQMMQTRELELEH
nr:hypothetical protein [Escherichia coli]